MSNTKTGNRENASTTASAPAGGNDTQEGGNNAGTPFDSGAADFTRPRDKTPEEVAAAAVRLPAATTERAAAVAAVVAASPPVVEAPVVPTAYLVFDTLAGTNEKREHKIAIKFYPKRADGSQPPPDTKTYFLERDIGTPMPREHAFKFLTDKNFQVLTPQGDLVTAPPKMDDATGGFKLSDDQTIAEWSELTKISLFKRCKVLPGGEDISATDSDRTMIAFLMSQRKSGSRAARQYDDADLTLETGDVETVGFNKMMPDSPLLERVYRG